MATTIELPTGYAWLNLSLREARTIAKRYGVTKLLSGPQANPKLAKSDKASADYVSNILHLAPATMSGFEVCPWRSAGCTAACLGHSSGRAGIRTDKPNPILEARKRKTVFLANEPNAFLRILDWEIERFVEYCQRNRKRAAVRLNGTSDLHWERTGIIDTYPAVQFYDYSKSFQRVADSLHCEFWPENYDLTYSANESHGPERTYDDAEHVLRYGGRVAVVFLNELPTQWRGRDVIDADKHDLRFADGRSVVCGLLLKATNQGKARKLETATRSGFARITLEGQTV